MNDESDSRMVRLPVREMRDEPGPQRAAQEGDLPPLPLLPTIKSEIWELALQWAKHGEPAGKQLEQAIYDQMREYARLALAAAGGGVPQGWKLVPVEPTHTMLYAMSGEWHPSRHEKMRQVYGLALVNAPASPQPEAAPAVAQVPQGWKLVPIDPDAKALTLMAGAILYQPFMTADNRHPYWEHAVEQAEAAYRVLMAAAPEAPAQADPLEKLTRLQEEMGLYDQAPAQEPRNVRERWNIEFDGEDLLVCFNDHDKGDKCRYQRYVPAQAAQSAGEVERNAQKLRARFDELLNRYWSLGHAEGKEGSNHDTEGGDAQITLCELHDLFRAALSHKEPQR